MRTEFFFSSPLVVFTLTNGPRSEVKTGLELKCNLSREQVDKSLFFLTWITPDFWEYLYRVVHTPRTSSSRTYRIRRKTFSNDVLIVMDTYDIFTIVWNRWINLKCTEKTFDEIDMINFSRFISFDSNEKSIDPSKTYNKIFQILLSWRCHCWFRFIFSFRYFHIAKLKTNASIFSHPYRTKKLILPAQHSCNHSNSWCVLQQ